MHWTDYISPLMEGAWVTIQLTFYSTVLGALLAFAAGIGKLSHNLAIKAVSVAYIEVFRGTSLLVQLFWLYFALPIAGTAMGIDLRLPPVLAGVLALSLNIGAYGAEVVRGAIQSVHTDQPSFGNLAVQNLKDTALVSLISLGDLTFRAEQIRNFTQDSTTIYTMLLFTYFGMALVLTALMRWLERAVTRWRTVGG